MWNLSKIFRRPVTHLSVGCGAACLCDQLMSDPKMRSYSIDPLQDYSYKIRAGPLGSKAYLRCVRRRHFRKA